MKRNEKIARNERMEMAMDFQKERCRKGCYSNCVCCLETKRFIEELRQHVKRAIA